MSKECAPSALINPTWIRTYGYLYQSSCLIRSALGPSGTCVGLCAVREQLGTLWDPSLLPSGLFSDPSSLLHFLSPLLHSFTSPFMANRLSYQCYQIILFSVSEFYAALLYFKISTAAQHLQDQTHPPQHGTEGSSLWCDKG